MTNCAPIQGYADFNRVLKLNSLTCYLRSEYVSMVSLKVLFSWQILCSKVITVEFELKTFEKNRSCWENICTANTHWNALQNYTSLTRSYKTSQ